MLLLSLITTETVQVSLEKLPPHVVMTSLADIPDQDNCQEKVIILQDFLQGPCSNGQRSLCLALGILPHPTVNGQRKLQLLIDCSCSCNRDMAEWLMPAHPPVCLSICPFICPSVPQSHCHLFFSLIHLFNFSCLATHTPGIPVRLYTYFAVLHID